MGPRYAEGEARAVGARPRRCSPRAPGAVALRLASGDPEPGSPNLQPRFVPKRPVRNSRRPGRDALAPQRPHAPAPAPRREGFGDEKITTCRGRALDPDTVEAHRTELERQHRATPVTFAQRGRTCGERYREVRYEDFCADPIAQGADLFAFVDVPFLPESRAGEERQPHPDRHVAPPSARGDRGGPGAIGTERLPSLGYP